MKFPKFSDSKSKTNLWIEALQCHRRSHRDSQLHILQSDLRLYPVSRLKTFQIEIFESNFSCSIEIIPVIRNTAGGIHLNWSNKYCIQEVTNKSADHRSVKALFFHHLFRHFVFMTQSLKCEQNQYFLLLVKQNSFAWNFQLKIAMFN